MGESSMTLNFEENIGQKNKQIKFTTVGEGYEVFFTPTGPVITFMRSKNDTDNQDFEYGEVKIKVEGARPDTKIVGENKLEGKPDCFTGDDPEKWIIDIPKYEKIRYQDIYPGIDLVYFGKLQQLAYNFVISPGADPRDIILRFRGADKVELDDEGNLLIQMRAGNLSLQKPKAYQNINGEENEADSSYVIWGKKNVSFFVGEYKREVDLIIG